MMEYDFCSIYSFHMMMTCGNVTVNDLACVVDFSEGFLYTSVNKPEADHTPYLTGTEFIGSRFSNFKIEYLLNICTNTTALFFSCALISFKSCVARWWTRQQHNAILLHLTQETCHGFQACVIKMRRFFESSTEQPVWNANPPTCSPCHSSDLLTGSERCCGVQPALTTLSPHGQDFRPNSVTLM